MQLVSGQVRAPRRPLWLSGYFWGAMLLQAIPIDRFWQALLNHPNAYIDDAVQHIFWMWRFVDPARFQDDLMAEYFSAQMPPGLYGLYWAASFFRSPLLFNKLLPVALGLIAAVVFFALAQRLFNSPRIAFWASLVFILQIWTTDDISTGIARSFAYPLLLGFLYTLVIGWRFGVLLCLALSCLFYPPVAVLAVAILALTLWPGSSAIFELNARPWRRHLGLLLLGLLVCGALLLPGQLWEGPFGPIITKAQALSEPALLDGGRSAVFDSDPWRFWVTSKRTSLGLNLDQMHPLCLLPALLLPLLHRRSGARLQTFKGWSGWVPLLGRVVWASLALYGLAMAVLLHLYHPNRYVCYSLPVVAALFSGVTLAALAEHCARWLSSRWLQQGMAVLLCVALVWAHRPLWPSGLKVGEFDQIYRFLRAQPATTRLASYPTDAGNLPLLSGLPVVASMENALAWHPAYYRQMEQRLWQTLEAFYTDSPQLLADYVERYGVDLFVVPLYRYAPPRARRGLFVPFASRASDLAKTRLFSGVPSVLQQLAQEQAVAQQDIPIQRGNLIDTMAVVSAQTIYRRAGRS